MSSSKFLQILIVILFFVLIPLGTEGVVLYLESSQDEYQPGDTFIIEIRIDTEEECINTVKADLEFSQDILKAVDFSKGNSILTFWVEPPLINQAEGLISFAGGIPGGYCGIIPGDPGRSNLLGKMIFKVGQTGVSQARVKFLDSSQVLLNDRLATEAELTTQGITFGISPERVGPSRDEWLGEIKKDTILPEPFEIEVHQEPSIFEGKYFITFFTTDKQTGIDHYKVKEGEKGWKRAESPYLLENQSLQSIIKVKAVDKTGNERVAEYKPPEKPFLYYLIIILVLVGAGVFWLWKKYIKKQK